MQIKSTQHNNNTHFKANLHIEDAKPYYVIKASFQKMTEKIRGDVFLKKNEKNPLLYDLIYISQSGKTARALTTIDDTELARTHCDVDKKIGTTAMRIIGLSAEMLERFGQKNNPFSRLFKELNTVNNILADLQP